VYNIRNADKSERFPCQSGGAQKKTNFDNIKKIVVNGQFVRQFEVSKDGHPRAYLASDQQLNDLSRFCCSNQSCILGIDPTFKLGPFYLTCTTFRHPLFCNKDNQKHVLVPGPFLLHATREESDYAFLGQKLSESLGNKTIKAWSTDGEAALIKGLKSTPSFQTPSIHLRCIGHEQDNCKEKLKKIGVSSHGRRKILNSIFGSEIDSNGERTRKEGLIDCNSAEEFDSILSTFQTDWDSIEKNDTGKNPQFWFWFRKYKSQEVKETMLKPVRIAAGLGNPPATYRTNDNECFNSVLKRDLQWEKKSWDEMATELRTSVERTYREMQKAVYGMGEYRLAPEFNHLAIRSDVWIQKTKEQRQIHLNKVFKQKVQDLNPVDISTVGVREISISVAESKIGGFRPFELHELWAHASILLSQDGAIVKFPQGNKYCFLDGHKSYGIAVQSNRGGIQVVCENCSEYKYFQTFCRHTIAVSDENGQLSEHIADINQKASAETLDLVLQNSCTNSGEKGTRRKGKNNTTFKAVVNTTPLLPEAMKFTQAYHNNDPFQISFIDRYPGCKSCASCAIDFPKAVSIAPHDILIVHQERFKYPKKDDRGKTSWIYTRSKTRPVFYHCQEDCVQQRHPYFTENLLQIDPLIKDRLRDIHKRMLQLHFTLWI
jgi:hypothetical protein